MMPRIHDSTAARTDLWQRLSPWASLFVLSFAIRLWGVNNWLLPNVDEIVLMNTLNLRFLEGCSASSAYWPAHWILRAFFFLQSFHHYRLISVLFGALTILVIHALALRLARQPVAWAFCALLSVQWYFLYMSRIIEIASFIPLITAICLWAVVRWRESNRPVFAMLFFGLGGIGANIWTPPMFYLVGAGTAFFLWETVRSRLSGKWLFRCLALLLVALSPYLYVLYHSGQVKSDILLRYQMTGETGVNILPVNLVNPTAALKTWTYLVTFFHEHLPWQHLTPFSIGFLVLPFFAAGWVLRRQIQPTIGLTDVTEDSMGGHSTGNPHPRMNGRNDARGLSSEESAGKRHTYAVLLFLASIQVVLLSLSPVPLYIEGHAAPLLLCLLLLLLGLSTSQAPAWLRGTGGGFLLCCLLASFGFFPRYFDNQQARLQEWLRENVIERGQTPICISDGVHVKLTRTPGVVALGIPYDVFTTAPDDPFWGNHAPGDYPWAITTYECDLDKTFHQRNVDLQHQFSMNNLYEAHLRHGIDVWRIIKTSGREHNQTEVQDGSEGN